ncbi:uncharacterized protein LOC557830 [Danio rerio]|uniref:Si:dkey-284p5.3 n=1 Tax=Danio rerio TaxID=7955 RepID=Q1L8Q9_DANRE|nr:uncharacterized protein LOC557830 [Danio rerio]|eukprot:NP_001038307.1 uncharacterized protein LOC557830 [Danio rerio]
MGCTSSTQTTAQDTTRPKHDGCAAGTSNENGGPAGDTETILDLNEEVQCSAAASAHTEPEAAVAESNPDQPESNPSATAENTEDPAPSENATVDQAESSPPEETPASGQDG